MSKDRPSDMDTSETAMANSTRWVIQDIVFRYARSVDRRDWEGVLSCYHEDATDDHGGYSGGRDGLVAWMMKRHETLIMSMHFISNVLVDFIRSDVARVESYCSTVQRTTVRNATASLSMYSIAGLDDAALDDVVETDVRCRFVDIVTERDGVWRIVRRTVVFESMDYRVFKPSSLAKGFTVGSRSNDDSLWTTGI